MTSETSSDIAETANAIHEPCTWQTVEEHLVRMGLTKRSDGKFANEDVLVELCNLGNSAHRALYIFKRESGAQSYSTTDQGFSFRPEEVIPLVMERMGLSDQRTIKEHAGVPTPVAESVIGTSNVLTTSGPHVHDGIWSIAETMEMCAESQRRILEAQRNLPDVSL